MQEVLEAWAFLRAELILLLVSAVAVMTRAPLPSRDSESGSARESGSGGAAAGTTS